MDVIKIDLGNEISRELKNNKDQKIQAGIRPEDVLLSKNSNTTSQAHLKVLAYENMGNEQLVYLSLAESILIARRAYADSVNTGDELDVNFITKKIIFFNDNDGKIIKNQ
jgi:ABC-type sugar transport system ATPase subunit